MKNNVKQSCVLLHLLRYFVGMCKWPWCGLWLSHHIATYLCSNFTSSTDLLEVNTPTTSNVTKWDAIHSDWQYLLEFNNKFGNWRGCPIYGPFPHRPFHRGFWVCGYQAQGMKSSSTFFDTRLGVFYKLLYLNLWFRIEWTLILFLWFVRLLNVLDNKILLKVAVIASLWLHQIKCSPI